MKTYLRNSTIKRTTPLKRSTKPLPKTRLRPHTKPTSVRTAPRRIPVPKLIKQADKLFSLLVRRRGSCQKCGATHSLQTAHVIPRTYKALRWNEDNALCLCYRCHIFWSHKNPLEFVEWYQANFPINFAFLMREKSKLDTGVSQTIEFTIKELQEKLKQHGAI